MKTSWEMEKLLLFLQCFQKAFSLGALKVVILWQSVNQLPDNKILDWSKLKQIADIILKYI